MNPSDSTSVIIPSYNAGSSVGRAIKSVLAQTAPVDEIIVVDDGSTDNTSSVCRSFGDSIKYIVQSNAGSSAARNTGVMHAAGDWIAFLDADDAWNPTKNELQRQLLQRRRDLQWVSGGYDFTCGHEFHRSSFLPQATKFSCDDVVEDALQHLSVGGEIWTGTVMVRRSVLTEVGEFDVQQRTSHDVDLWLRIAAIHPNLGWVKESISQYEVSPDGLTITSIANCDSTLFYLFERARERRDTIPSDRQRFVDTFLSRHANTLFKGFLSRGDKKKAMELLRSLNRVGFQLPAWLNIALRMPGNLVSPLCASYQLTRRLFHSQRA